MKKRNACLLLAALVLLVSLFGCAGAGTAQEDAVSFEGTWYFAKNGVACCIQDGKIYQDDLHAKEGQSLLGVYTQEEDHIVANLVGVGGVHIPHELYLVSREDGAVLCDSAAGDGAVYFYQDALTALAAVEAAPSPAPSDAASGSVLPLLPLEAGPQPTDGDAPAERFAAPSAAPASDVPSPSPSPIPPAERSSGSTVWVSQTGSKYHADPGCSGMKDPSQFSRSEAESQGYTPCKRCY